MNMLTTDVETRLALSRFMAAFVVSVPRQVDSLPPIDPSLESIVTT